VARGEFAEAGQGLGIAILAHVAKIGIASSRSSSS
jgi:hypothetical protein